MKVCFLEVSLQDQVKNHAPHIYTLSRGSKLVLTFIIVDRVVTQTQRLVFLK